MKFLIGTQLCLLVETRSWENGNESTISSTKIFFLLPSVPPLLHELQEIGKDLLSMLHSVTKMPPLSRVLYSHCMSQIPIVIGNGRNKYPVTWIVSNSSEGWFSSRESKEGVTRTIKSALWLALWQYGLWGFQTGGTKLERFLPKNQHTQINFWILRIGLTGSLSSLQKSEFLKLIILIFHVKKLKN